MTSQFLEVGDRVVSNISLQHVRQGKTTFIPPGSHGIIKSVSMVSTRREYVYYTVEFYDYPAYIEKWFYSVFDKAKIIPIASADDLVSTLCYEIAVLSPGLDFDSLWDKMTHSLLKELGKQGVFFE
tara:strand:+ start:1107 stop:1484 length:378 start_codon:yes stop_codon:yes gene_type:complete